MPFFMAAALVVSAFATVKSMQAQSDAADEAKEAREKQSTLEEIQASRNRTQAVREARVQRAQAQNIASQTGAGESSGIAGGISSSLSNLGTNISRQSTDTAFSQSIGANIGKSQELQGQAAMYGSVANFAGQFVDYKQVGTAIQGLGKKT